MVDPPLSVISDNPFLTKNNVLPYTNDAHIRSLQAIDSEEFSPLLGLFVKSVQANRYTGNLPRSTTRFDWYVPNE
ncbi:MAG: hypothetical protein WC525_07510 [Candidatus Thermoplasmatota archaeon]